MTRSTAFRVNAKAVLQTALYFFFRLLLPEALTTPCVSYCVVSSYFFVIFFFLKEICIGAVEVSLSFVRFVFFIVFSMQFLSQMDLELDNDQLLLQAGKIVAEILKIEVLEAEKEKEVKKRSRKRSCWTTDWLLKRPVEGACAKLLMEWEHGLPIERNLYDNFRRMNEENFCTLLEKVGPLIQKQDTMMRKAISPDIRLNATLYYLTTGDSFQSLQIIFRVSKSALHQIIPKTAKAIYQALAPEYLKVFVYSFYSSFCFIAFVQVPSTEAEWMAIAERYETVWNVPNYLGSLDGKHIKIIASPNAGSAYYNYKHFHSIVLMAMCDADYRFTYIDVG